MVRRLLILCTTLACALAATSVASAAPEQRGTFSGVFNSPAGTLCDFHYLQVFTINYTFKGLPNGSYIEHDHVFVTHTNVDTGYALHERDRTSFIGSFKGTGKNVGVFWHLRNAAGKIVVVQAGQLLFDSNGNIIKVTAHFNPDFAGVICPALGGAPAG